VRLGFLTIGVKFWAECAHHAREFYTGLDLPFLDAHVRASVAGREW
jgi:hypothetical protein